MAFIILKEDGKDSRIEFTNPLTIGKKSDNKVPLDEISASRFHCQIIEKNGIPFEVFTENGLTPAQEIEILKEIELAKKNGKKFKTAKALHKTILNA